MTVAPYHPREYPDYARLTELLHAWAGAWPDLCSVAGIGTSPEGRTLWALTLTNAATGPAADKPACLVEANIHAGEVTGSAVALYTAHWLLQQYGRHPEATRVLDTRAMYLLPRVSVDGAEAYLKTPYAPRSALRLYPEPEERPGLLPEDVDGDGRILLMRVPDPLGEWRVGARDPRLMVRRQPQDGAGVFYRVLAEGVVKERAPGPGPAACAAVGPAVDAGALPAVDAAARPVPGAGVRPVAGRPRTVNPAPPRWGLDFNRNYPAHWSPEARQPGAGPYPLSEPETRAVADFVVNHPNIGAYLSLHTHGGVWLRPPATGADDCIPAADLDLYRTLGQSITRLTGCPVKSTFDAFATGPDQPLVKGADDWAYEHRGLLAFTVELWDPAGRAGATGYGRVGLKAVLNMTEAEREHDEWLRLRWHDRELGGAGFVPWRPFLHPQLGPVEIGGWDPKFAVQNPPPHLLPEEAARHAPALVLHALVLPELACGPPEVTALGGGCYKVAVPVQNRGYLPTAVTRQAEAVQTARPVAAELGLPAGARLVAGKARQELGHLAGAYLPPAARDPAPPNRNAAWARWVVQAPAGARLQVTARCPRAGVARIEFTVG